MSFAEVAQPLRAILPCSVVGEAAWERFLEFAAELPACVANRDVGFEVPLGSSHAVVDFGFAVCPAGSLAEALSVPGALVPKGHAEACARYLRSERAGAALLESLLFEYDLASARRLPALFAVPHCGAAFRSVGVPLGILGLLRPGLAVAQRRRLAQLFDAGSKEPFGLSSVGLFPGREVACLRLNTIAGSLGEVPAAASWLGWAGDPEAVTRVLRSLPGRFQYQVGVDVLPTGAVGERLGVEVHVSDGRRSWIEGGWSASTLAVWRPVFDALVSSGRCVRAKAAALLSLDGPWTLGTGFGPLTMGGGINHLKLVFARETVAVKAYPAFGLLGRRLGPGTTSLAWRSAGG